MKKEIENQIINFTSGKKIIHRKILKNSFGMNCEKITLENNKSFIAKYYNKKNKGFNSLKSEGMSLSFLFKKFPNLFPKLFFFSDSLLIMEFIEHNNILPKNYQKIFAKEILKIHSINNDAFGFNFDTQIGGLKQLNKFETNWVNFYRDKRLNMIFEEINKTNPMPANVNKKIQIIIKNLHNFIPKNPLPSLLHGDLWEGNILFHNCNLVGLIDPGIYFGHNELEIAYLTWFKFINKSFLNIYSDTIKIDKKFSEYEPIYQLYFSLLNVHLWDRNYYIKDVYHLLEKIKT